jgi:hypothetical protein
MIGGVLPISTNRSHSGRLMKWRSSELNNSDIIREVTSRVKEFALGLPELKTILQIEN